MPDADAKRLASLERGIEGYLDGTWRHGWRPERDKCVHGKPPDETCEECLHAYFRAVLGGLNLDDPGGQR